MKKNKKISLSLFISSFRSIRDDVRCRCVQTNSESRDHEIQRSTIDTSNRKQLRAIKSRVSLCFNVRSRGTTNHPAQRKEKNLYIIYKYISLIEGSIEKEPNHLSTK